MQRKQGQSVHPLFKAAVLTLYLAVAIYLYVHVVLLYLGAWKHWFMRTGNFMYWVYLTIFSWIYVKIMKILWKWQVRVLT